MTKKGLFYGMKMYSFLRASTVPEAESKQLRHLQKGMSFCNVFLALPLGELARRQA